VKLVPTSDRALVESVLSDPWIASRLARDGGTTDYVDHPLLTYHAAYVGDRLAGVFIAVRFTTWEVEVHVALLPWAVWHGRTLGRMFLAQMFDDPDVMRVTANVMSTLPSAANYCRRLGFRDEGRRREAFRAGGVLADVIVLGLTRGEWEAACLRPLPTSYRVALSA
jgi:RimJ/RimL family protein N-acetyltransferase